MDAATNTCADCGTECATTRCKACQRRHNDHLQAEHDVMVRAMFRALNGHTMGNTPRRRATSRVTADSR